jgi:Flp pilus assembly protein TadB
MGLLTEASGYSSLAMSDIGLIAVILGALILLGLAYAFVRLGPERRQEVRQRLRSEANAHREQAMFEEARARELGRQALDERREAERHAKLADEHAEQAAVHAERAAELEDAIARAGRYSTFHIGRAVDHEEQLV